MVCLVEVKVILLTIITLLTLAHEVKAEEVINLKPMKLEDLTVSGLSSGAYMAVQVHVSHSRFINGSAVFAGGPFYCAASNIAYAEHKCMDNELGYPETEKLIELTRTDATLAFVDNPDIHMRNDKIYIFSSKNDSVVKQTIAKSLRNYYEAFTATSNIVTEFDVEAEHCMPTLDEGVPCTTLASPYIGLCHFDGAGHALNTLYKDSRQGFTFPEKEVRASLIRHQNANLFAFDQTPYFVQDGLSSLGDVGYIYIPTACQDSGTTCRLHISFHGCEQNLEEIGNEYAMHAGFNAVAEANNIVVVYPYAKVSRVVPYNPKGCWDWWAYTGVYYGTKKGVQIEFVRRIIEMLGIPIEE